MTTGALELRPFAHLFTWLFAARQHRRRWSARTDSSDEVMKQAINPSISLESLLGRSPHKKCKNGLTIKLDGNWIISQLASRAPPPCVNDDASVSSATMFDCGN